MSKKLAKLEAIRGFAAVYVILHHTIPKSLKVGGFDLSLLFRFGQEAVILFFLLSGFVIQYAFEKTKDKSFKTFFFKRFFRIYIPLVIVFITSYLILCLEKSNLVGIEWRNLAGNLLMLQDVGTLKPNVICEPFLGNLPLWSLSYEWWFYMLFFVVWTKFRKHAQYIVYTAVLISAITYLFYPFFLNREVLYLGIWWAGADMALLYAKNEKITFKGMRVALAAILSCCVILVINVKLNANNGFGKSIGISPYLELRHIAFALVSVTGAIIWSKFRWALFDQTIGIFTFIAPISFGLYISHYFLMSNAHYLDFIKNDFFRYLLYLFILVTYAYIIERVVYPLLNKRLMEILFKSNKQ